MSTARRASACRRWFRTAGGPFMRCGSAMFRRVSKLVVGVVLTAAAWWTYAASVTFTVTPLGGVNWRYDFVVTNDALSVPIEEFTVYFAPDRYSNLVAGPTPGWDMLVVQPDPLIPDDGFYDGLVLSPVGIVPGASQAGFAVTFKYLGTGSPGAQPFEIVDPRTFQTVFAGMSRPSVTQKIAGLYIGFFERAGDLGGQDFWRTVAESSGLSDMALMRAMAAGFANHPSFTAIYGALSNDAYVDAIYLNVGGQPADAAGKAYWLAQINGGQLTRSDFVADFIFGLLEITEQTLQDLVSSGAITEQERQDALRRKYRMTHKSEIAHVYLIALGSASNLSAGTDPLNPASLAADPAYRASQNIIRSVTEEAASKEPPLAHLAASPSIDSINKAFGP